MNHSELMFSTVDPTSLDHDQVALRIAQSFHLVDTTNDILENEGHVHAVHATSVVKALVLQLEEVTVLLAIQNKLTKGDFEKGLIALQEFYSKQIMEAENDIKG